MTGKSGLFVVGMFLSPLAVASVAGAATVVNVNFDGTGTDADTVGAAPQTGNITPPLFHPTSISEGTLAPPTMTVQDAGSATPFAGFGVGKFVVLTAQGDGMNFSVNSTNYVNTGISTFTFDYRRDGSVTGSGTFYLGFYVHPSQLIGQLLISDVNGGMQIMRYNGTDNETAAVSNLTLDANTNYTIQGILDMNGAPTLKFNVTQGATTTTLLNGKSNSVSLNGGEFYRNVLTVTGTNAVTATAVDNITRTHAVPEPAGLGALAVGGLLMLRRRRNNPVR